MLVQDLPGLADLLHRLRGIVGAPDIANLGPVKVVLLEEFGGGEDVVVDFVGGDAELEAGERKRAQAAGEEQRGGGQEIASGRRSHTAIIAAGRRRSGLLA